MTRRSFISQTCVACAGALSLGAIATMLQGCSSLPVAMATIDQKVIRVNPMEMANTQVMIVRVKNLDSDILLVKTNDGYRALKMTCTHQIQPLTATSTGLYCSAHGSTFDLEGKVTREPAQRPLIQYKTAVINENEVNIYL